MRYVSLFSGIEAASVAWEPLGWEPVAFCEIDAFPSAVLAYRFPNVPNLGDITKVDWNEFKKRNGSVDLVVGGSPCQSFSIAGGREGLDGESRLMYEYIRAVSEIRPSWFLWENVPGVFSTDGGRAFGILLDAMEELGYGMAWRVLDAQFFGVAQRRRRVFLVGHLGDGGGAAAVLFDADSVRGNTESNTKKREELTGSATKRSAICMQSDHISQNGTLTSVDICKTLDVASKTPVVCVANDTANAAVDIDACGTLLAGGGSPPMIASVRSAQGTAGKGSLIGEEVAFTVCTSQDQTLIDADNYIVRRLTPKECERLQGFPDDWTKIPYRGKPAEECPDGARYKACGNSMAVPVMRWIGQRINMVESLP